MRNESRFFLILLALVVGALPHSVHALTVTDMSPAPGTTIATPPASISVTLSDPAGTGSVNANSVRLVRAGADGLFSTADDVTVVPAGITTNGNAITVDLTGVKLPNDKYQLTLAGRPDPVGLAAYWKFDEASGTTVLDSSGQGINGTLIGGATRVPGVVGGAIDFNGVDSYVSCGDALNSLDIPLSVALWVYRRGNTAVTTIASDDGTTYYGFWMHIYDDNTLEISYGDGTGTAFPNRRSKRSTAAIANNTWTHVAAVIRGPTDMSLYINGVDAGGAYSGSGGPMVHSGDPLVLGHKTIGNTFIDAQMDEFRVYNRALSQNEVAILAGNPASITDQNGNPLDGAFTGTFPSGDGTFQNFVASFTLTAPLLQVTALSPAPGASLGLAPTSIVATLSKNVDPASVNTGSVRLVGAGPDGLFGTGDDVTIVPNSVSATGSSITMDLTGVSLPSSKYQLTLASGPLAPTSGLAAYYKFDETSGTAVADSSGNNLNGIATSCTHGAGVNGNALVFNGNDSIVNIGAADIPPPWTAAMWVNRQNSSNVSADLMTSAVYYLKLEQNPGLKKVGFTVLHSADYAFNYTAPIGTWVHLTYVGTSTSTSLYVNGVLTDTIAQGINMPMQTIGAPFNSINASLDELHVYNRNLSPSEIVAVMNQGISDLNGNALDGEYPGQLGGLPSGNGTAGGDFVTTFAVDIPAAVAQSVSLHSGTSLPITLSATDVLNNPLTYTIVTPPAHGTLSGAAPNITYSTSGFAGADSFAFKANNTLADSNIATVSITVTDAAPVAIEQSLSVHTGAALPIVLSATDTEHDGLTYAIVASPAHGTLSGVAPNVVYTSGAYSGPDSFTFSANDGVLNSSVTTISITVTNQAPALSSTAAAPSAVIIGENVSFTTAASDPDGDVLTYLWNFGDGSTSSDAGPMHAYAASGTYTASVTVTDIAGASVSQSVTVNVYHDSDLPIARFTTSDLNGYVGQPLGFDATFSTDPLNNIVSYVWDFGDGSPHGAGQLISRDYTATGTYTVTLTITNGLGLTDSTSVTMVILPSAQAGLFSGSITYKASWNRSAANADSLSLNASINVGTTVITKSSLLSLGIVGQTFTGTSATKLALPFAAQSGPRVKWQIKPNTKKGAPKGTYALTCSVKHASLGQAFALAGVTGTKSSSARIPIRLGIGGSSFESSINSQFRFGSNGAKASGGGTGPK